MSDRTLDPERTAGGAPSPSRWTRFSRSHARTLAVALAGAAIGAAYAHFIGCASGRCPLTSNVWSASLYGAAVGAMVGWPARARPLPHGSTSSGSSSGSSAW